MSAGVGPTHRIRFELPPDWRGDLKSSVVLPQLGSRCACCNVDATGRTVRFVRNRLPRAAAVPACASCERHVLGLETLRSAQVFAAVTGLVFAAVGFGFLLAWPNDDRAIGISLPRSARRSRCR